MQKSTKKPFMDTGITCSVLKDIQGILDEEEEYHMYREWWTRRVPHDIVDRDPFLRFLRDDLESRFGIMRLDPHHGYKWHVDAKRQGTINMLLRHGQSLSMFSPSLGLTGPVMVLPYEIGRFYYFDTQEPHQVINFNEHRYMFTTEILGEHKDKKIVELKEIIDELYIR